MFCGLIKPKFYRKCKSKMKKVKIRLNLLRNRKNAEIKILNEDIVNILLNRNDDEKAYRRVGELLEQLTILSSYDLIEKFCDCILANLSLMAKNRECPEECKEAVSSLIYAAAWIHKAPELKNLRSLFTYRYGNSIEASVNQQLIEKFARRESSQEIKIQRLEEIAKESKIRWDPKSLEQSLVLQVKSRLLGSQVSGNVEKEKKLNKDKKTTPFQRYKIPDYDELVAARDLLRLG